MKTTTVMLVAALSAVSAFAEFNYQSEMTVSGYAGESSLEGFPILVRISSARIPGYRGTLCQDDGKDIRFLSPDGETTYPHEIEHWDPSGESLVWVRLPELSGTETKFLFQFGDETVAEAPSSAGVWASSAGGAYAGVWHFGERATTGAETVADSAKRQPGLVLDAVPEKGTKGNMSQMVSVEGPVGYGRINATTDTDSGNRFVVPSYDALGLGSSFTFSGWVKATGQAQKGGYFVSRKTEDAADSGWQVCRPGGSSFQAIRIHGTSSDNAKSVRGYLDANTDLSTDWRHVVAVLDGETATVYVDGGAKTATCATFATATENGLSLVFGCDADGNGQSFHGMVDEYRLLDAVVSADWAKAEYDTVKSSAFLTAGEVEQIGGGGGPKVKICVMTDGSGSVYINGNLASEGTNTVEEGESGVNTITATASEGWRFVAWRGTTAGLADVTNETLHLASVPMPVLTAIFTETGRTPATVSWRTDAPTTDWYDAANWAGGVRPTDGDTVVIADASAALRVTLNTPTPRLAALTLGGAGAEASIIVSNWTTFVRAERVNIGEKGVLATVGSFTDNSESNRVHVIAGTLSVETGGVIRADGAGYASLNGPGWRGATSAPDAHYVSSTVRFNRFGGTYGGQQGYPAFDVVSPSQATPQEYVPPQAYGNAEFPLDPGSGAGAANRPGGGAIFLEVTGALTVDGCVSANAGTGASADGSTQGGFGSGGGILVFCKTVSGTGSVMANSGSNDGNNGSGAGSGGRIAVHYDAAAQATVACCVRFEARGGYGAISNYGAADSTWAVKFVSEPGSLWFTDNGFLSSAAYRDAGWPFAGVWEGAVPLHELAVEGNLSLGFTGLRFPAADFRMSVSGDLTALGDTAALNGLEFKGGSLEVGGNVVLKGAGVRMSGGTFSVAGNLTQAKPLRDEIGQWVAQRFAGEVTIVAAPTNAPDSFGAELSVGGCWTLEKDSFCFVLGNPTNGAIPRLSATALQLDAGAAIQADRGGWARTLGPGGSASAGASYGGLAGYQLGAGKPLYGTVYGDERNPIDLGSGGKADAGSGAVYLMVSGKAVVNGRISADAQSGDLTGMPSSGSAGSVLVKARKLTGTGRITADGPSGPRYGYRTGLGSGGRVAVWRALSGSDVSGLTVTALGGTTQTLDQTTPSEGGTVYWGELPSPGLMLILR